METAPARPWAPALLILLLAVGAPGTALAVLDAESPADFLDEQLEAAGERAIASWNDENPWRYGTDYLFPLTRGIAAEDLHVAAKAAVGVLVAPFDLAYLPFGALAGLWGD